MNLPKTHAPIGIVVCCLTAEKEDKDHIVFRIHQGYIPQSLKSQYNNFLKNNQTRRKEEEGIITARLRINRVQKRAQDEFWQGYIT